jgi:LysR family transcriptional regulator, hydrogen peroxide-inducible genes activator
MDLRQLAALVAIADHGSFSAAAKALFTVQSNVSAHIARLEQEVGATLVDRSRGRLTDEGQLVAARARAIQQELDAIYADLASRGKEVAGEARIGVISTTARWLVPQVLTALRAAHPLVRAIVVESPTTTLLPQLAAGQLDSAVVNLPIDEPDSQVEAIFEEEMLLLVTATHPLAERSEVALAELAEHRLLLPAPGTSLRQEIDAEASREGIQLAPLAEIDGVRLLTSLALDGFGATIVPATALPSWLTGNWVRVPVRGLAPRQVGLARRRRTVPSAPARAVAEVLRDVVRTKGPLQRGVHVLLGSQSS